MCAGGFDGVPANNLSFVVAFKLRTPHTPRICLNVIRRDCTTTFLAAPTYLPWFGSYCIGLYRFTEEAASMQIGIQEVASNNEGQRAVIIKRLSSQ